LALAEVDINRKVLSELAVSEPEAFAEIVSKAKDAIDSKAA